MSKVTLDLAKKLIAASENEAKKLGIFTVITIVDESGNVIACHRMDDAWLASIEVSQNKAWTSAALKMTTADLTKVTLPGAELYGLTTTNNGRIVVFGGGIPLVHEGKVIGAVGVSGSSVVNDIRVAEAAVNAFENVHNSNSWVFHKD